MNVQPDKPLTEEIVARLLMQPRWVKNFCLPRYTPADWWENDVFQLTPAGYWTEFEIKLTFGDFRADEHKQQEHRRPELKEWRLEKKHDLLKKSDSGRGPNKFYFVAPVGVIPVALVPTWAGLIEINTVQSGTIWEMAPTVRAPRLHMHKVTAELRQAAVSTCYWRFHRLR